MGERGVQTMTGPVHYGQEGHPHQVEQDRTGPLRGGGEEGCTAERTWSNRTGAVHYGGKRGIRLNAPGRTGPDRSITGGERGVRRSTHQVEQGDAGCALGGELARPSGRAAEQESVSQADNGGDAAGAVGAVVVGGRRDAAANAPVRQLAAGGPAERVRVRVRERVPVRNGNVTPVRRLAGGGPAEVRNRNVTADGMGKSATRTQSRAGSIS